MSKRKREDGDEINIQEKSDAHLRKRYNYRGVLETNGRLATSPSLCFFCLKSFPKNLHCDCKCFHCKLVRDECECIGFFTRKDIRDMFFQNFQKFQGFVRNKAKEHNLTDKVEKFLKKQKVRENGNCYVCWGIKKPSEICYLCLDVLHSELYK
jgi:hypothetical protein